MVQTRACLDHRQQQLVARPGREARARPWLRRPRGGKQAACTSCSAWAADSTEAPWATATRWLATIAIEPQVTGITAGELRARLAVGGIQAGPPWTPLHLTGAHRGCAPWRCPVAERLGRDALHLPSSVTLTGNQQDRVLVAVRAAMGQPARA